MVLGAVAGGALGGGAGGLIGNIALLAGAAGSGGKDEYKQILALAQALETPTFDRKEVVPPEYQILAEYFPEEYQAIIQQGVSTPSEGPEMRDAQLRNLANVQQVADEGLPLVDELQSRQIQSGIAREGTRGQNAILENLAMRGRLSGGDEIAARMIGNQQSSNLAGDMGSDLLQQSLLRRLQASYGAGEMAGGIRSQDFQHASERSNVMNRFNEWTSQMLTQQAADNAGAREQAQFANVGRRQQVGDQNEQARYLGEIENLNRLNTLSQFDFENDLSKFGAMSSALGGLGDVKYGEQTSRAEAVRGLAGGAGSALGGLIGGRGAAPVQRGYGIGG